MEGVDVSATDVKQRESIIAKMSTSLDMDMPSMSGVAINTLSKQVNP
jgi:hypothetical protein